jgi:hypothetical protein
VSQNVPSRVNVDRFLALVIAHWNVWSPGRMQSGGEGCGGHASDAWRMARGVRRARDHRPLFTSSGLGKSLRSDSFVVEAQQEGGIVSSLAPVVFTGAQALVGLQDFPPPLESGCLVPSLEQNLNGGCRLAETAAITFRSFSTIPKDLPSPPLNLRRNPAYEDPNHQYLPSFSPPWWSPTMRDVPHPRLQPACFVCEVIPGPLRSCDTVDALGSSLRSPQAAISTGLTTRNRGRSEFSLFISARFFLSSSNFWTLPLSYLALFERNAF